MTFDLYPWRFGFIARGPVLFPPGKAANVLRGAMGFASAAVSPAAARRFAPLLAASGPSGLADAPRPYVFRASHLDGRTFAPGECLCFDLHVFETRVPVLAELVDVMEAVARAGLGWGRGRLELTEVRQLDGERAPSVELRDRANPPPPLRLELAPLPHPVGCAVVRFATPTELKQHGQIVTRPEFAVLFARARDRISSLSTLYGQGALPIDFEGTSARAAQVRMVRCEVSHVEGERRSSRTGQTHPLGGFVGEAEYAGDLAEFIPWLRAAAWTGVGRQTAWGKGEISVRC